MEMALTIYIYIYVCIYLLRPDFRVGSLAAIIGEQISSTNQFTIDVSIESDDPMEFVISEYRTARQRGTHPRALSALVN